jgi:prepilin-type N-terminal cleavage/methylation domain-containing protein/prepilin-type processing-associated H-X9-DG protein
MRARAAFTLIELLVVVAIIAILIALVFTFSRNALVRAGQTKSLNNMRQIGTGFQLYANDNDFNLPSRTQTSDKWPALLSSYLRDPKVFADPADPKNFLRLKKDPLSNASNNTSYIMNGFNDVGAYSDEKIKVKLTSVDKPSETILLASQSGSGNFYMDLDEDNQNSGVLRKKIFNEGANYLFVDGSVRFIKAADLTDELWFVHKPASP